MTDQQIIRGIQQGQEQAFKALVDQHQEMVINVCNSFVHNKEDALDISQEVFIKAYGTIGQFRQQSRLSTWLYRIAVNQSLNFIRDNKRRNIFSSLDLLFDHSKTGRMEKEDDKNQAADERMEQQERLKALYKAMDKLPQKQKAVLTLNKMEALSYKEIADIMDISVSETGVLINRAKKKLQQKLVDRFKNM